MAGSPDYSLRAKGEDGVTIQERRVLRLRSERLTWAEMSRQLGVTRERVNQVRKNLIVKGLLTEQGNLTKKGKEAINAKVDSNNDSAGAEEVP